MGFFSSEPDAALLARIARLERKVDMLLAHLQIESPDDGLDGARALLAAGNKIGAIKAYRDATGADLMTAKQAVDRGLS